MKNYIRLAGFGVTLYGLFYMGALSADPVIKVENSAAAQIQELSFMGDTSVFSNTLTSGSRQSVKVTEINGSEQFKTSKGTFPLRTYKPLAATNDPASDQWWTRKSGLDQVWDGAPGSYRPTVAVIDTGTALQHEEFSGRWAINNGEQGPAASERASKQNCTGRGLAIDKSCNLIDDDYDAVVDNESGVTTKQNQPQLNCTARSLALDKSCNLIDDDANGYADDVRGWDFINYDRSVQAGEVNPDGAGTAHASQVTGVLAATGNNSKGIAGVNWSAKILPIQAINDDEYGNTLSVARAIRYAADRNADVINLSLGGSEEDAYLRESIQYALDKGSIVVAASGNDGCECISYPARYPEVIAVGAESSAGGPASFSSWGSELDILAPGYGMVSSSWSKTNQTQLYASGLAGTSFAAPYVSGLLSLGRSHQPDASWAELAGTMQAKADHSGLSAAAPFNNKLGSGYARANSFVQRLKTPDTPGIRYYFDPLATAHPLDSKQIYQCQDGEFPATMLYELSKNSDIRYSVNKLDRQRAVDSGWAARQLWYACTGLGFDNPGTNRTINLKSEIGNQPADKTGVKPLTPRGMKLYVNPDTSVPVRATQIMSQPRGTWLADPTADVRAAANQIVSSSTADRSLATLVAYNIPGRDCGSYSAGGLGSSAAYRTWIRELAAGIGNRRAIVILEPDALAQIDCLNAADQAKRYEDLADAVGVLAAQTKAFVYIDAGHSAWVDSAVMAQRLKRANVAQAQGFSLNVSNFQTSAGSTIYGNRIAELTNKNFVIDTGRNGLGATTDWCNPAGRALGTRPTTSLSGKLDAYLWIKVPGESDGTCNGGPSAGVWWEAYAQGLISNAGL